MKQWELDNLNKLNEFFNDIFGMIGIDFAINEGNGLYIEDITGKGFSIQVNPIYDTFEDFEQSESNFYGFELFYALLDENGKEIEEDENLPKVTPSANIIDLRKDYTYEQNAVTDILSCLLPNTLLMNKKDSNAYAQILNVELHKEKLTDIGLRKVYHLISRSPLFEENDILQSKIQRIMNTLDNTVGIKDF